MPQRNKRAAPVSDETFHETFASPCNSDDYSGRLPSSPEPAMSLRDALRIPSRDLTEESVYRDRRRVLAMLGAVPALGIAGCSEAAPPASRATITPEQAKAGFRTAEEQTRELDAT